MDTFRECAVEQGNDYCPEMVVIPAGSFMMGSPFEEGADPWEQPQHLVKLTKRLAVSKFEVTFDEWDTCLSYGDCPDGVTDSGWGRGQRPVSRVTWDGAQRFVGWLSKITGKQYRLLTEAEWEYAARAGTIGPYSFEGDQSVLGGYGWYSENSGGQTHPVGEKKPNGFGLYDMHGNVWEWVQDCVHPNYAGAPLDGSAWIEAGDCKRRIVRGGAWLMGPEYLRSTSRSTEAAYNWGNALGFRVARTLGQ